MAGRRHRVACAVGVGWWRVGRAGGGGAHRAGAVVSQRERAGDVAAAASRALDRAICRAIRWCQQGGRRG